MTTPAPTAIARKGIRTMQTDSKRLLKKDEPVVAKIPERNFEDRTPVTTSTPTPAPIVKPASAPAPSTPPKPEPIPTSAIPPTATPSQAPSLLASHKEEVFDVGKAFDSGQDAGTIVSDKKRKPKSIFGILGEAFGEWSEDTTESVKSLEVFQKPEVPKVAPGTERKEIIQKAIGAKEAPIKADDHKVVIERIRTFKHDAEVASGKPFTIKKNVTKDHKEPTWSHTEDSQKESNLTDAVARMAGQPIAEERREIPAPAPIIHREQLTQAKYTRTLPEVVERQNITPEEFAGTKSPEAVLPPLHPNVRRENITADGVQHVAPVTTVRTELPPVLAPEEQKVAQAQEGWLQPMQKEMPAVPVIATPPVQDVAPMPIPAQAPMPKVAPEVTPIPIPEAEPEPEVVEDTPSEEQEEATLPTPFIPPPSAPIERPLRREVPRATVSYEGEYEVSLFDRLGISLRTAVVVLLVAVVTGVGSSFLLFGLGQNDGGTQNAPTFISTDTEVRIPLSNDRTALLTSLRSAIDTSSARVTHTVLVFPSNETGTQAPVATADFFAVLDPRTGAAFIRSLEENMMIGGIEEEGEVAPFIIVKSNVFDVAFAGMLEWEAFMSADLAPLFGTPVGRSLDSDSRALDGAGPATFRDRVVENQSTRVLVDETGEERIVYGFINRNTIIITSSEQAFTDLLSRF